MSPKSTEVAERAGQELTLEQVEDMLLHGGEVAVVSADAVQDDMVRRILQSDSVEGAFANFKATPASELAGQLVEVGGIAWMRSSFDEGPKVYALLNTVVVETGEALVVSMGGRSLMASFVWAQRNRAMPIRGTFMKERSNSNTERSFWVFKLA